MGLAASGISGPEIASAQSWEATSDSLCDNVQAHGEVLRVWRSALERLSRGVVLRRRLPARFGSVEVLVSPDAALRFWRPNLERVVPELFAWVEELVGPGDVVWDIGANLGLFSLTAALRAREGGEVMAVEPDPWLCGLISRSRLQLPAGAAPVRVECWGAAAADGAGVLAVSGRGRAANHLDVVEGTTQAGRPRASISVPLRSLDSLARENRRPSLIKIDVEGAESLVLEGAARVLRELRARLLVEVDPSQSAEVGRRLRAAGYRVFDADLPAAERRELEIPAWNTLAIPVEQQRY